MSISVDESSRYPVRRGVRAEDLGDAIASAMEVIASGSYPHPAWKVGALLVQRTDQTLEARRERFNWEFYNHGVDKNGRAFKRRKYPMSQIERDWQAMVERDRKEAREAQQAANAAYKQRRNGT